MDKLRNPSETPRTLNKKRFYSCFVPSCTNNSVRNPEKYFATVPSDETFRKKWFEAVGKEYTYIFKTVLNCCDNHFDLDNDAEKMINSAISGGKRLILKKDVVPHIFQSQEKLEENRESGMFKDKKHEPSDSPVAMDKDSNVFSSNITRSARSLNNDLTELLNTVHAQPVEQKKSDKIIICDFQPRIDKHFEPKKKARIKVKTVREIRHAFEKDVYSYLPAELKKQQTVLLRKIRTGSSRDEKTKILAKNMLKCDNPITRSAWQMLMNLNPEEYPNSTQFVLLNGKRIRVNGSKGGKCKFLCKYDLGEKKVPTKTKSSFKRKSLFKKMGLLQNSLSINFKPGPLTKKTLLDDSYQKYHVGEIELLNLPMPGLEIQPTIGKAVDATLAKFLHNMQPVDGTISDKWAEFSVSVLSTIKNENIVQCEGNGSVTFDLSYKCDQKRMLMRRDISSDFQKPGSEDTQESHKISKVDTVKTSEIEKILDEMLDSVEISIEKENMYTGEDEFRITEESTSNGTNMLLKDKPRRKYGELEKLDVTIIRLSENSEVNTTDACSKAHCTLGCLCASLECALNFKTHCGRPECMFECKCDFSKYKVIDSFERDCSDLIPGLLNIDNAISSKMAKEEQKFHQTVIVTSENSIVLKSKRRDWKSSRKYAEFYSSMCLKAESKCDRVPAIVLENLSLDNVESWCMIHNLYKCFCRCIFTDNSVPEVAEEAAANKIVQKNNSSVLETSSENLQTTKVETSINTYSQKERIFSFRKNSRSMQDLLEKEPVDYFPDIIFDSECARAKPFTGRKHCNEHYLNANKKIIEMEKHDHTLRNRMLNLMNKCANENSPQSENVTEQLSEKTTEISGQLAEPAAPSASENREVPQINMYTKRLPDKKKLVLWLETSYKHYKQRVEQGIVKVSLDPPKLGKMALYPWEFILSRYRDKKNLFLISKGPQYRIFMAVDTKNPFFNNCIDINDIRFADLHKYPSTVKNLLTNATDLKDNFCILCGLSTCWELIGSVTKIGEQKEDNTDIELNNEAAKHDVPETSPIMFDSEESNETTLNEITPQDEQVVESDKIIKDNETPSESSKWFVMTVENDFEEIQFYNKGFFVKLQSIIKAINVARSSGKTVRLSSQKCADGAGPQFGIYAIPNHKVSCVFVGPYEKHEPLGIETIKNIYNMRIHRRTRGVWITTKKLENFEVIDNPLSFMPSENNPVAEVVTLSGDVINADQNIECATETNEDTSLPQQNRNLKRHEETKILKPIKIRKTNGFFHLAPNGTLQQISPQKYNIASTTSSVSEQSPTVLNASLINPTESRSPLLSNNSSILTGIPPPTLVTIYKRPIAEIAPHVKIPEQNKKERGMLILKPEEINKRHLQNLPTTSVRMKKTEQKEIEMDIENFLATAEECAAPSDDILVISDDENDMSILRSPIEQWTKVWIESKTVDGLGWIPGRLNEEGLLSFEFPGFKYTDFYEKKEAYAKLTQVLSRKIYLPKNLNLDWDVIDSEQKLTSKHMLKSEELDPDFVMTKRGIRRKQDVSNAKSSLNNRTATDTNEVYSIKKEPTYKSQKPNCIEGLEKTSQLLENESQRLWNKLTSNSDDSEALDDLREQIAARLQSMVKDMN